MVTSCLWDTTAGWDVRCMRVDSKMSKGPSIRNGRKTATRYTALRIMTMLELCPAACTCDHHACNLSIEDAPAKAASSLLQAGQNSQA